MKFLYKNEIRHKKEEETQKTLKEAVELLEKTLDFEKFNREQQYMDMKQSCEYERERILKRQYMLEKAMKKADFHFYREISPDFSL